MEACATHTSVIQDMPTGTRKLDFYSAVCRGTFQTHRNSSPISNVTDRSDIGSETDKTALSIMTTNRYFHIYLKSTFIVVFIVVFIRTIYICE